jgi:D-alanyl-D-alanine dipeptidase
MRRLLCLVLLSVSMAAAQPAAQPQFFHITPVRPVEELRKEALKAQPPIERREFLRPDLVELVKIDPTIKLDIRYATNRNFLSTPVYEEARAFMQRPAAEAVARASQKLHEKGFGLMIYDAYRPWYVTKIFWDATPPENHKFVADPAEGSRHNRGCAVDLTLYDLKTGEAVPMTGLYDEMSERSYPNYKGGTEEERRNRETLRSAMEAEGFTVYEYEWWHFDFKGYEKYPILNLKFADVPVGTFGVWKNDAEHQRTVPRPISTPDPYYTRMAQDNCIEGTARAYVAINDKGVPKQVILYRTLGYGLDENISSVLKDWRFEPATLDSRAVPFLMNVEVSMHLTRCRNSKD